MAHPQEIRDKVRKRYIVDNQPLELAAGSFGVPLATARSWKYADREKGEDWDKLRAKHLLAGGGMENVGSLILAGFLVQYEAAMESLHKQRDADPIETAKVLTSLADSFNKTVAASKKILPETQDAVVAVHVIDLLMEHISRQYPEKLADFSLILQTFQSVVEREFG